MWKSLLIITFLSLGIFSGCAAIKQGINDYQVGKSTPLATNEVSPSEEASPIVATASVLPIIGPFAGILGIVLTGFFTWQRGANIRKNNGVAVTAPASGLSSSGIIQDVASIAAGIFTTSSSSASGSVASSVWQRVWKVALSTVGAATALAVTNPSFMAYLTGHPVLDSVFVAVTSGIAGLEKGLSNVPVVASSSAVTPTV